MMNMFILHYGGLLKLHYPGYHTTFVMVNSGKEVSKRVLLSAYMYIAVSILLMTLPLCFSL